MITMNPPVPDTPATLETLSNLVGLLSDPVASKARVAELAAASAEFKRAVEESKAQQASFALAFSDHRAALEQQAAEAAAAIFAAQNEFDTECARRKSELDAREEKTKALLSEAQADASAAASLRAAYDRKLAIIKSATGWRRVAMWFARDVMAACNRGVAPPDGEPGGVTSEFAVLVSSPDHAA
jgi:hypothetical protein